MKLKHDTRRRLIAWAFTLIAFASVWALASSFSLSYGRPDWFTGFVLVTATAMLMLLSLRKKLLVLPLGKVSFWLQCHQYLGAFALCAYFLHAGVVIRGWLELALASLFLFTSLSGIVNWYLNRSIPIKLRAAGPDRLLSDMPELRHHIAVQAYAIAIEAAGKIGCAVIAEHYRECLVQFFQRPRTVAYAVIPNGRLRRRHVDELERLDRYLSDEGRSARSKLCRLVQEKDNLDYQEALQLRLRVWNGIHVSAIGLLWIMIALHILLAYRFHGS